MRLRFDELEALRARLSSRTVQAYAEDWDDLVDFAGWTWPDYAAELDRRWESADRAVHAFLC